MKRGKKKFLFLDLSNTYYFSIQWLVGIFIETSPKNGKKIKETARAEYEICSYENHKTKI